MPPEGRLSTLWGPGRRQDCSRGTAVAGDLGWLCSVCCLSAGVSSRTHLRWPTPVRPSPDSRVKGRDFQILRERLKSGENSVGTFWNGSVVPACVESSSQRKRFPDFLGEKNKGGKSRCSAQVAACCRSPLFIPPIKSFRKGEGGAGEGREPFVKIVN